jgi:hypothetical protein
MPSLKQVSSQSVKSREKIVRRSRSPKIRVSQEETAVHAKTTGGKMSASSAKMIDEDAVVATAATAAAKAALFTSMCEDQRKEPPDRRWAVRTCF